MEASLVEFFQVGAFCICDLMLSLPFQVELLLESEAIVVEIEDASGEDKDACV